MASEHLRVREGNERGTVLSVDAELLVGRRAPEEQGRLGGDPELSRRHALVRRGPDRHLTIEDLGSANGTFVNDERVEAPRSLRVGDVIRIGRTVLEVAVETSRIGTRPGDGNDLVLVISSGTAGGRQLTAAEALVIGRDVRGEGRLSDDPELSRRHARVERDARGRLSIDDLGSANGTFVNGERVVGPRELGAGDIVRVGTTTLEVTAAGRVSAPPAWVRPAAGVDLSAAPVAALGPGSLFAGCRVEAVIGHGDMGIVYRAEELALQRRVALKLILSAYAEEERFRERFRRESRIAAAIDHQNVIPIFDAGDEDSVLYIMMRLVEGTDLRTLIANEGGLAPLRAARIVRQVGAALDAAHARGMLHRDVKPSNVLLARRDHVYLTDFGLAKPADAVRELTRQGTVVARAEYVAPEQILGRRVDARADVYALGCLLFETLTGEPPFAAGESAGPLAHLDLPPPSPSALRPGLPTRFDEVVCRAMARDPRERYPSAGDLGQAALVAAGALRRASRWSVVAIGDAAPLPTEPLARTPSTDSPEPEPARITPDRLGLLRWGIAIAGLVIVAVAMIGALNGISTL
jgi:pSer/pThr/pTyr-binding forkhead associated (FHA) protein/predicted Ser/Thr protein kinase